MSQLLGESIKGVSPLTDLSCVFHEGASPTALCGETSESAAEEPTQEPPFVSHSFKPALVTEYCSTKYINMIISPYRLKCLLSVYFYMFYVMD